MGEVEHSNEHRAAWAMQELSRSGVTFSERVEARKVIGEIVKQADAYRGAVEALREIGEMAGAKANGADARAMAKRAREFVAALDHPGGQ